MDDSTKTQEAGKQGGGGGHIAPMENLIPTISKLQNVFATIGSREAEVELPQIVVVGSQSAGKSSVIEGIVGRDFLPRGSGIVTRRPLLLHLHHVKLNDLQRKNVPGAGGRKVMDDWAVFEHKDDKVFTDFEAVREEIEAETDRVTGTNKGISLLPIILKIFSHRVLNLSLIDLPGITKLAVGDQPKDIEAQIRRMIQGYIANTNSVILAVTPANQDFATSEPMKIARELDPQGQRTIAVLTKLDLMDRGTDAMDVLTGKLVPVKLGIIGVVNRSQEDINGRKSIEACLKDEASFLARKYPTLASCNGIPYLARTLTKLLMDHIRACLPALKQRISTMIVQCQAQLQNYGEPVKDKARTLLKIISDFSHAYTATIDGTSNRVETNELRGGARIHYIFFNVFAKDLDSINPMEGLTEKELLIAIQNTVGIRSHLFVPDITFELLVKRQILRLEEPSLGCVDYVHDELLHLVQSCGPDMEQEIQRFPRLFTRIQEILTTVLSSHLVPTKEFVSNLVNMQLAYVNNRHPEFNDALELLNSAERPPVSEVSGVNGDAGAHNAAPDVNGDAASKQFIRSQSQKAHGKTKVKTSNPPPAQQPPVDVRKSDNVSVVDRSDSLSVATSAAKAGLLSFLRPTSRPVEAAGMVGDVPSVDSNSAEVSEVTAAKPRKLTPGEKRDCQIIERLIKSYYSIVRKTIQDQVPKAIMLFLVNRIRDTLQNELVRQLYDSASVDELLSEDVSVAEMREATTRMLEALRKANAVISEVRETYIW